MSEGLISQGFKLEIMSADSPPVPTEVKEVTDFDAGSITRSQIEMTHLRSQAKEFKPGLADYGTFKATCNFVPGDAGQGALRASTGTSDILNFKATYEDGSFDEFAGFVVSDGRSGSVDNKIPWVFELKLTGPSFFTEASS